MALEQSRDPLRDEKLAQSRWPHLGALKLFAGERWQFINYLFDDDFSQYDPPPSLLLPLPMSLLYTPLVDKSYTWQVRPEQAVCRVGARAARSHAAVRARAARALHHRGPAPRPPLVLNGHAASLTPY